MYASGIGKSGGLPWKIPGDMTFFKEITTASQNGKQNAVIMGRKTWEVIYHH
jgi:dihydrofolate reductase/thymidylate synthase